MPPPYGVATESHGDDEIAAALDMTLTPAACPLNDVFTDQTQQGLNGVVDDIRINWVCMPPWESGHDHPVRTPQREQLRSIAFNISVHPTPGLVARDGPGGRRGCLRPGVPTPLTG